MLPAKQLIATTRPTPDVIAKTCPEEGSHGVIRDHLELALYADGSRCAGKFQTRHPVLLEVLERH